MPLPLAKSHSRNPTWAPRPQVRGQFRAGDAHGGFDDGIRVVSDHNFAILPGDPVQIGNRALHVEPAAVRSNCLSNGSAPVVYTGEADRQKPRPCRGTMVCQTPEGEGLEFTLGDHDGEVHVAEKLRVDARHDVQHIGSAGRAEVLLARLEVAGGIRFEIRVITAQAVLANVV